MEEDQEKYNLRRSARGRKLPSKVGYDFGVLTPYHASSRNNSVDKIDNGEGRPLPPLYLGPTPSPTTPLVGKTRSSYSESNFEARDANANAKKPKLFTVMHCYCTLEENMSNFNLKEGNYDKCQATYRMGHKLKKCTSLGFGTKVHRVGPTHIYKLLCPKHLKSLVNHECCPICGFFCCGSDDVLICEHSPRKKHLFHYHCALRGSDNSLTECPHCGQLSQLMDEVDFLEKKKPPLPQLQEIPFKMPSLTKGAGRSNMALETQGEDDHIPIPIEFVKNAVYIPSEKESVTRYVELAIDAQANLEVVHCIPNGPGQINAMMVKAVESKDFHLLAALLERGGNANFKIYEKQCMPILLWAVETGDLKCIHILYRANANPNVGDKYGITALMMAGTRNQHEIVHYLMAIGADPAMEIPSHGFTALHAMAKDDSANAARAMKLSDKMHLLEAQDDEGLTPLMTACRFQSINMVKLLTDLMTCSGVQHQILKMIDDHNESALHWAARGGSYYILSTLLNMGANPHKTDISGNSALHIAVDSLKCNEKSIQLLIKHGADPYLRNAEGHTAFDLCRQSPFRKSTQCLKSAQLALTPIRNNPNGILLDDISNGREGNDSEGNDRKGNFSIKCTNNVDSAILKHGVDFTYITKSIYHHDEINCILSGHTCSCDSLCHLKTCVHDVDGLADQYLKYSEDFNGRLELPNHSAKMLVDNLAVFECNEFCLCNNAKCRNRVVQKGLGLHLEVFRTKSTGWGVRSLDFIHRGEFICELVGEIMQTTQAAAKKDNKTFLYEFKLDEHSSFFVDSSKYGNVSRFLNHSCDPNTFPCKVFVDSLIPRIAFFALREISAGEELTFDYTTLHAGCSVNVINNMKRFIFNCNCHTSKCTTHVVASNS